VARPPSKQSKSKETGKHRAGITHLSFSIVSPISEVSAVAGVTGRVNTCALDSPLRPWRPEAGGGADK
jgi:hypothetical protein